jgi:prepilin-type N-terminal cleavage/methylation domain-containing protein
MIKKAFTLLEILIVIIIIGILAAFAIPKYIKAARKAVASEAVTNIGALRGAEIRYYQEYGVLTTNFDALDVENPDTVTGSKFDYSISGNTPDDMVITANGNAARSNGITVTYNAATGEITTNGL